MTQSGHKGLSAQMPRRMSIRTAIVTLLACVSASVVADKPDVMVEEIVEWTFDQAENVACFTVRQVLKERAPILYVVHDASDHGWQFLTGDNISMEDAMIVSMREIVEHDPTLLEIGDMPPGYSARRAAVGEPWKVQAIRE
jgi:hypothetical protein